MIDTCTVILRYTWDPLQIPEAPLTEYETYLDDIFEILKDLDEGLPSEHVASRLASHLTEIRLTKMSPGQKGNIERDAYAARVLVGVWLAGTWPTR